MSYCAKCGQLLKEDAKFCTACGTTVDSSVSVPSPAMVIPPTTKVIMVAPKRGGWLAIKAFFVSFFVYLIGAASLHNTSSKSSLSIWMAITFCLGAVYVIVRLRRWKQQNNPATGMAVGWIIAAFMILMSLGGLAGTSRTGLPSSTGNPSGGSPDFSERWSGPADTKGLLMQDMKLDFKWSKSGFDNIMIADFTIKNPTQFRFKDVEIKCTHSAPSGTEIDSNTRTIYEVFEPHSTKKIKQMNMGFIHSQVAGSGCRITDLTVLQ